jgi:hypothetical protein
MPSKTVPEQALLFLKLLSNARDSERIIRCRRIEQRIEGVLELKPQS